MKILFFILNNIKTNFTDQKLSWKLYITIEAFTTTKQVELIRKIKFVTVTLNLDNENFVIYIASFTSSDLHIYLSRGA